MAQKFVQKARSKTNTQARYSQWDAQDAATDKVLDDALKASKRARKLLRQLKAV